MSGCDFRIGQKVVCVDGACVPGCAWNGSDIPVEGAVYTVDGIITTAITEQDTVELVLREIKQSSLSENKGRRIYGYGARRFRPLDEDRYDISIFQEMCVRASKKLVSR